METVSYKATVRHLDPNKADGGDPLGRGYGPRVYENKDRNLVQHWMDHVLMDNPEADILIEKVVTGPVDA